MNETTFAFLTIVISIMAVIASIVSAIYARRSHEHEIEKYKKESKEKAIPHVSIKDAKFIFIVKRADDLYKHGMRNAIKEKLGLELQNSSDREEIETLANDPLKSGVVAPAVYSTWYGIYQNIKEPRSGINGIAVHLTSIKVTAEIIIINESDVPSWIDNIRVSIQFKPPVSSPWFREIWKWNGYIEWFALVDKGTQYGIGVSTNMADRLFGFPTSNNYQKSVEVSITDFITSNNISLAEPVRIDPNSKLRWLATLEFTINGIQTFFTEKYNPNQFLIKTQFENESLSASKGLQTEYHFAFIGAKGNPEIEIVPSIDWDADIQKSIQKYVAKNIDGITRAGQEKYKS